MSGFGEHPSQEVYRRLFVGAVRNHKDLCVCRSCRRTSRSTDPWSTLSGHGFLSIWGSTEVTHLHSEVTGLPGFHAEAVDIDDVDPGVVDGDELIPLEFLEDLVQRGPLHAKHGGKRALREFD